MSTLPCEDLISQTRPDIRDEVFSLRGRDKYMDLWICLFWFSFLFGVFVFVFYYLLFLKLRFIWYGSAHCLCLAIKIVELFIVGNSWKLFFFSETKVLNWIYELFNFSHRHYLLRYTHSPVARWLACFYGKGRKIDLIGRQWF